MRQLLRRSLAAQPCCFLLLPRAFSLHSNPHPACWDTPCPLQQLWSFCCLSCSLGWAHPAIPAACPRFLLLSVFAIPSIHHYCVRALINLIDKNLILIIKLSLYAFLPNHRKIFLVYFLFVKKSNILRITWSEKFWNTDISRKANSSNIARITVFMTDAKIFHSKSSVSGKSAVRLFRHIFYHQFFCSLWFGGEE